MRRLTTALALLVVVTAASCGDDVDSTTADPTTTTATTTSTTSTAPVTTDEPVTTAGDADPIVGCPSGPTFPLSALDDVPPVTDAEPGVEAAMQDFLANEEGSFWPQDDWRVLHETSERVLVVHVGDRSTAADTGLSFMTLEADGDEWRWAGASSGAECPLQFQLADGLGVVEWELDPAYPTPAPDDTVLHVLATERGCAGGQAMGDRLNEPVVLGDDSQVGITLSVVPLEGYQDCPGNPQTELEVDLGEPLGDRRIVDGREVGVELEDLLPPN